MDNLNISPVDIPAIADIDYDGDLDVLTFSILGGFKKTIEKNKKVAESKRLIREKVVLCFSELRRQTNEKHKTTYFRIFEKTFTRKNLGHFENPWTKNFRDRKNLET